MIAGDTSSVSAYFNGDTGSDVERIEIAFQNGELILPAAVLTELFSDPSLTPQLHSILDRFELLEILPGYWVRAGYTQRKLRALGLRAKLGDALIAQCCIDNDVSLITRDPDFRHFVKHCGLKLA